MKLCIPEKVLESHAIWLGKTGAGKSSAMRHIVEWLLANNRRVCIVDPKGEWTGLKSSADGKSAGYPVIALGDFKEMKAQDIPINAASGKVIAELVASGNRPCVIGLRGWTITAMTNFWIDFACGLFNSNTVGGIKLFVDEIQNFGPKERMGFDKENMALHWTKRLLSEGRGIGLAVFAGSQRPASVHNGVLTQCETLVAMRVIHKSDRKAVQDWIEGCGDGTTGKELLDDLAQLQRREAYVWSPECRFGPERLTFPMFETFDSFAPPQTQRRISEKGWADVNLDEVKEKLSAVIEEQKANDPAQLKTEIRSLKSQLRAAETQPKTQTLVETKTKTVPVLTDSERSRLTKLIKAFDNFTSEFNSMRAVSELIGCWKDQTSEEIQFFRKLLTEKLMALPIGTRDSKPTSLTRPVVVSPPRVPVIHRAVPIHSENGELTLGRCERSILTALAQYPQGRSAVQVALLSEYSVSSGGFNNSLGKLRSAGFITRSNPIQITEEGMKQVGNYEPLPTGEELARHWISKLGRCEAAILSTLIEHYPVALTPQQIGDATHYSPQSGGFNNALGRLRTLELITRGQPIKATDEFFQ